MVVATATELIFPIVRFVKQVLSPGLVCTAEVPHDLAVNMQRKPARSAQQVHARLFRSPVTFLVVTTLAAGNQIIPCRLPSTRARLHMVECEFRRRILLTAILAGRMVTQKDVFSRERAPFERNMNVFGQTNYRRRMD